MNTNILPAIIFAILALILGITDTIYAGYDFNKEDKNGIINNNIPLLFIFTGIIIIISAVYYINILYPNLFIE
jgi:formate-dependent nitrite reductase membrane component NrfD